MKTRLLLQKPLSFRAEGGAAGPFCLQRDFCKKKFAQQEANRKKRVDYSELLLYNFYKEHFPKCEALFPPAGAAIGAITLIQHSPSRQAFGACPAEQDGQQGWLFRLYAPHAAAASVVGPFNGWDAARNPMAESGGRFSAFLPGLREYDTYKFAIRLADGSLRYMADPCAFHSETPPDGCSKLYDLRRYVWQDQHWFRWCARHPLGSQPLHLYEVHLGSWRRTGEGRYLPYRVIAQYLVPYVKEMGFTGVLLLPVLEHADAASLGYAADGWFAPTSRFGAPADFMYLVDQLHCAGVSVFMDFPTERFSAVEYGLSAPDGIPPRKRVGYESSAAGGSCPFSLADDRVRRYLFTAAQFWLAEYHLDGLRLRHSDAQQPSASRLFRAISRAAQELSPPRLILSDGRRTGGALVTAEGWVGGLLDAVSHAGEGEASPVPTLRPAPRYSVLPLDHTVLAARGGSLVNAFSGSFDARLARARLAHLLLLSFPGKKLTFMGTEFGQDRRWHPEYSLDWHQLHYSSFSCQQAFFRDANLLYLREAALSASDDPDGSFSVLPSLRGQSGLLAFRRQGGGKTIFAVFSFSGAAVRRVRIGVNRQGCYRVLLNSDGCCYGGQGRGSFGRWESEDVSADGCPFSLRLEVPPLGGVLLAFDDAPVYSPVPVSPC